MKSRFVLALILALMLWPWGRKALAESDSVIVLTDDQDQYPLGLHLELLEDKQGEWTINDVTSPEIESLFVPSQEAAPGFGFTDSAYWVRFQVSNGASAHPDWVLSYDSLAFYIDAYFPSSSGDGYAVTRTGTALPFETRDIPVGGFAFHLPITPGETKTVYLRFASEGSLILPLNIVEESVFGENVLREQAANGILYGILFTLALYNFMLFVVLRDRSYLYYVLFFGSLLLATMSLDGFAAQYLWPDASRWVAAAIRFFFVLATIFALLFAMAFLQTSRYAPRLHRTMAGLAIGNLALAGLMSVWFRETALLQAFLLISSCVALIIAGAVVWQRGYAPAQYFLLGWSGIIFGFVIFFLTLANLLPFAEATNFIFRAGLIVLAVVLSFGLAARINLYRQEQVEAQLAIASQRARIAQDLHDSVTQSLYSTNLLAEAGRETLAASDMQSASHYFSRIAQTTQQALKEMRLFLYELRPPDIVEDGLVNALQYRIDAVEKRAGVEARLYLDGPANFPQVIEDQLYRIAQEALNNVLKHAQANTVTVHLRDSNSTIGLEIIDDGRGFDLSDAESHGGMGLQNMRARAAQIHGRLSIDTAPGQGTSVKVEVEKHDA